MKARVSRFLTYTRRASDSYRRIYAVRAAEDAGVDETRQDGDKEDRGGIEWRGGDMPFVAIMTVVVKEDGPHTHKVAALRDPYFSEKAA